MKQIVIEIEDEAYEPFVGMLRLCPAIKVVGTSMVVETRDVIDRCVALAIKKLREDGITRTFGKFPEWTFSDHPSADEVMRRKNVLKRFLSAYTKIKLNVSDAFSDY